MIRDITERKEREQELRAARQFNEELVENAPFGMFRLDEELRIAYENPRAEEIIGLPDEMSSSDAIGVPFHELPSVVETGQAERFTRLQDGETVEFEFPFESIYDQEAYFTGRTVPLYRDDEFDGAILMATDISERRRQERELEQQRDELETLNRINDLPRDHPGAARAIDARADRAHRLRSTGRLGAVPVRVDRRARSRWRPARCPGERWHRRWLRRSDHRHG